MRQAISPTCCPALLKHAPGPALSACSSRRKTATGRWCGFDSQSHSRAFRRRQFRPVLFRASCGEPRVSRSVLDEHASQGRRPQPLKGLCRNPRSSCHGHLMFNTAPTLFRTSFRPWLPSAPSAASPNILYRNRRCAANTLIFLYSGIFSVPRSPISSRPPVAPHQIFSAGLRARKNPQ